PLAIRSYRPNAETPVGQLSIDLDREVAKYERELITQTLEVTEGNRAEAARRLGISRARLLRKLDGEES
ncbi:MAG: helix-turn-helix domain-containing protein, partial [Planctomycetota bacterium]